MKINKTEQDAINAIANNQYFADLYGEKKSKLLADHRDMVEKLKDDLRAGIAAEFPDEHGNVVRCRLVMKQSPRWSLADCVTFATEAAQL